MKRVLVVALLTTVICHAGVFQKPDAAEFTIRSFAKAISASDIQSAAKMVVGGKLTPQTEQFLGGIKTQGMTMEVNSIRVKPGKDPKNVVVAVSTLLKAGTRSESDSEEVNLTWQGNRYLIVPPAKNDLGARRKPINSMAVMLSEGMQQVFQDAKQRAKATVSLSNIKQLALATIMLASDHDDMIATTVGGWHKAIFPYCKNERLFKAPGDKGPGDSYALNSNMAKKTLSKVKDPSRTVLIYEGKAGKLSFRENGKAAVAYCDGHAKLIDAQAAKQLIWKP